MRRTNRHWLPNYCDPLALRPNVQDADALFRWPPHAIQDFVGKAYRFLMSDEVREMGFEFDADRTLPCKWKCADESVFGVDLAIYAQSGHYPFDKGAIGGCFNEATLGAAVHHGPTNIDFGGSHVGYEPGQGGGYFGRIWRPQHQRYSTDCGRLMAVIEPYVLAYEDAIENILLHRPDGERTLISVPNEFLQPHWSKQSVKMLVDVDALTAAEVSFDPAVAHTHAPMGCTLFEVSQAFLDGLDEGDRGTCESPEPTPIGRLLRHEHFNVFDARAPLGDDGLPREKLLLYMDQIVAAQLAPPALEVAIINANIEHNHLADTVRSAAYREYGFASFSGVFIDLFDERTHSYANLFQPLGLSIKPRGRTRGIELTSEEVHQRFEGLEPAEPAIPMGNVLRCESTSDLVASFTYAPGHFRRDSG